MIQRGTISIPGNCIVSYSSFEGLPVEVVIISDNTRYHISYHYDMFS